MKLFNLLIGILLLIFACSVSPTTINGRFTVIEVDATKISVLLQLNTNIGTDHLGGTTIVFNFDTTAINFPINPVKDVDYVFHNFYSGNYSSATITRPVKNQIWVNIDLPFINNNNGTDLAGSPNWSNVVTIIFDVVDISSSPNLSWLTSSPFWGVYDADNTTIWQTGEFEDLLDFPFPTDIGSLTIPKYFELAQNYPNPFNPSTKIKFTIPSVGTQYTVSVQLKIYDILGNEVATLVDEEKEPGIYEVEFNGTSHSGNVRNLASGIYIYRLRSSEFSDTKKMVLIR